MRLESLSPATFNSITQVHQAYASLMQFAVPNHESPDELSLGGRLLYTGELNEAGATLTTAANIAGAATLAASAEPLALRNAQREGVIDFLVNSLDEALRILKNEIRKHQPVAVAVSTAPEIIVRQMLDRGVLPDLLPQLHPPSPPAFAAFVAQGALHLSAPPSRPGRRLCIWPVAGAFAQRPAEFDALLLGNLPAADHANRRWLLRAPRYLGPDMRRLRSIECDEQTLLRLIGSIGEPPFSG